MFINRITWLLSADISFSFSNTLSAKTESSSQNRKLRAWNEHTRTIQKVSGLTLWTKPKEKFKFLIFNTSAFQFNAFIRAMLHFNDAFSKNLLIVIVQKCKLRQETSLAALICVWKIGRNPRVTNQRNTGNVEKDQSHTQRLQLFQHMRHGKACYPEKKLSSYFSFDFLRYFHERPSLVLPSDGLTPLEIIYHDKSQAIILPADIVCLTVFGGVEPWCFLCMFWIYD